MSAAYNIGLYGAMVALPISGGGKKLTAEVIEQGVKTTVTTGMKTLIRKAKLPTRRVFDMFPSTASVAEASRRLAGWLHR
ncbi:hypothetical protein ACQPXT_01205 (plasmid) [Streptomyces sp. CA-100214]